MKKKLTQFDRIMAAVTFAEANEHDAGKSFLKGSKTEQVNKEYEVILKNLTEAEVQS